MITYLLKVTLCALLFLVVDFLFLEKERMHHVKRFYLLFGLLFSFTIPFITIEIPSSMNQMSEWTIPVIETEVEYNVSPISFDAVEGEGLLINEGVEKESLLVNTILVFMDLLHLYS